MCYSRMVPENKSISYKISFPQLKNHPHWLAAESILRTLQKAGFEALIAGGAVRDLLMGRTPGDIDIATSAKPDDVEKLFPQTVAVGKAFGVIRVIENGESIEVATYRQDLEYKDGRRPEGVIFTNRVEDAKRRDFTINALFYDPFSETVFDDVDGKKDLDLKLLRCVGQAFDRFREDELRRLRLVRFQSQIGFQIEPETRRALEEGIEGIKKVSRERITEEITKMWAGAYLKTAFPIWIQSGMAALVDAAWDRQEIQMNEEILNLPRTSKTDLWAHYFSFFFEEAKLQAHFKLYRLPKDVEKFVDSVHRVYLEIPHFLKMKKGEQRYFAAQPAFGAGFTFYIVKKAAESERPKLKQILNHFLQEPALPPPLVKPEHLQPRFKGEELGKMLKLLFIEQLEQGWTRVDQAMEWLNQRPVS